jgi:ribose transport system ATP-binding protein
MNLAQFPNAVVCLEGIEKRFYSATVLRGVTLAIARGRILGLVGENGAGKSTLMNVLGGVLRSDAGRMIVDGQVYEPSTPRDAAAAGIAFIHQELNLFTNLTVAENLHLDAFSRRRLGPLRLPLVDWRQLHASACRLLEQVGLNVNPDTRLAALSPGKRQLVEIAKALAGHARLIILDEPTTSLTAHEAEHLFALLQKLRSSGVAMIYISHNLTDVLHLCDEVAVLRDGQLVCSSPVSECTERRLIEQMVGRSIEQHFPVRVPVAKQQVTLEARSLTSDCGIRDVSFELHAGEVLGIAGLVGAGRTELARTLFGLERITAGAVYVHGKSFKPTPRASIAQGVAFLTEDRRDEGLLRDASVLDNVRLVALPGFCRTPAKFVARTKLQAAVASIGDAIHLQGSAVRQQTVRTLSGGNQQKVVLAKWLLARPRVFILDEPTRGIDVGAKQEIYRLIAQLAAQGTAVLLISSEIEELLGLCDRILVMRAGGITASYDRAQFDREQILAAALGGVATHLQGTR